MEKKDYYVYERFRKDNNTCFYVGRGHGDRIHHKKRNKLHDKICDEYGYYTKIYKNHLTSNEASQLEKDRIKYYVDVLGYGIDIVGYMDRNPNMFLTNRSFGGEDGYFKSGKNNPQYGVSPKERMGSGYEDWFEKTWGRCHHQYGANNPNYHNDTLKKRLEANPELCKKWYSRPNGQNGRARKIRLLNKDKEKIQDFETIKECCYYVKDVLSLTTKPDHMRDNMVKAAKTGKPFHGFYYEFI